MIPPHRILLLNCQPIGDTLLASPIPRLLKSAYPSAELDMVVEERCADVFRHNPFLDNLVTIDARRPGKARRWWETHVWTRRTRYDMALNLSTNGGFTFLTIFSGARRRCGFSECALGWTFHDLVRDFDPNLHRADANVEVLRRLGIPVMGPYSMEMWVDDASQKRAAAMWESEGLASGEPVVAMNVGAGKEWKRWSVERSAHLADRLRRDGFRVVLVGGPGDVALAEETAARMAAPPVSFTGRTSLLVLAAILQRCAFFVTADTGPMHIASAMGVPTVALFGATDPGRYGPYGNPHRVIRMEDHSMESISEGQVYDAVTALWAATRVAVPLPK